MSTQYTGPDYYRYGDHTFAGNVLILTADFRRWSEARIKDYLQNNGLRTDGPMKHVTRTERDAGNKTIDEYHERYAEMHAFCCIIGCWQSAALFARKEGDRDNSRLCANNPQPAVPTTIAKFIAWKTTPDAGVCKFEGETVVDVNNLLLKPRSQQWRAPGNVDKFIACVKALHLTYDNLRSPYQNVCDDCVKLNPALQNRESNQRERTPTNFYACVAHAGHPRLMPIGNVITSHIVKSEMTRAKNSLDEKHIRKGSVQLLPGHIRTIYSVLMGRIQSAGTENGIFWLQAWVMILIGFNCFLRAKELPALKLKHIRKDGTKISNGRVTSLVVEVADGKADGNKSVFLKLHMKTGKFGFLCTVTWLLFYIDAARLKDPEGQLFLAKSRIENVAAGKEQHVSEIPALTYDAYRKMMRQLICGLFPDLLNDSRRTIGTHTLRYLGYTYATWGTISCNLHHAERESTKKALDKLGSQKHIEEYVNPLPIPCCSEIMTSARHASIMSTNYYMQTCTTLYWAVMEEAVSERELQAVPYWKSCYIGNNIQNITSLLLYSKDWVMEHDELASYFLQKNVGLPSQREERMKIDFHKLQTLLVNQQAATTSDGLLPYLMTNMDKEMANKILELIAHDMERAREARREEVRRELSARGLSVVRTRKRPASSTEATEETTQRPATTTEEATN